MTIHKTKMFEDYSYLHCKFLLQLPYLNQTGEAAICIEISPHDAERLVMQTKSHVALLSYENCYYLTPVVPALIKYEFQQGCEPV